MYLTAAGVANIMKSIYPDFDREEFLQQCRRFNLPTDKKIKEFSTGMKAKFKVLAALSHKAELLILDEPTVGLDVIARDEVLNMLREYMEENESSSILISSHISSDLESLCDDFYMIHAGKLSFMRIQMYCCQIMQFLKFQKKSTKNWISNTLLRSGKKLMDTGV